MSLGQNLVHGCLQVLKAAHNLANSVIATVRLVSAVGMSMAKLGAGSSEQWSDE